MFRSDLVIWRKRILYHRSGLDLYFFGFCNFVELSNAETDSHVIIIHLDFRTDTHARKKHI